jgi:acyl-CoA synthetase (AMP-forming)/AMP-acid ligase II
MSVNSPEAVEAYYACAKVGACFVLTARRARRAVCSSTSEAIALVGDRYLG